MSNRTRIEIRMNENYRIVKDEEGKRTIDAEGNEATLLDKLSNTYPRPIKTIIGKVNNVENGLIYLTSNIMKLSDVKRPYPEIKKNVKSYMRKTHNVPYYSVIELILIADSILSDKNLVADILEYEDFKDFENVDLVPVVLVKAGYVKDKEILTKRISYTKGLKKVIWEIKNSFSRLEDAARTSGLISENEAISPETFRSYNNDDYKVFKNDVKETIADIIIDRVGEDANILENVRGAEELKAKDLKELWLK